MTDMGKGQPQSQDRSAMKRDLVPIIVILVFTIVMTVVAITLWHLLHPQEKEPAFQIPDSASLLLRGENEFLHFQYERATVSYQNALRRIAESENRDQALIPFLIHLRLTEIYLRQDELALAEKHLAQTEQLRGHLEKELTGMQTKLRFRLEAAKKAEAEENTAIPQKTEMPK